MVKRSTMASSSPKPSKRYSLRSISLPARSHPSTLRVEEQLNKIKSWEASTSSSKRVETICLGLSLLGELYRCIDDLLNLPLTQQALAQQQHQKWVNDLLEGSLGYLDVCGKTRDAILSMQESIRELQSALRRKRVGDLSVESIVTSYTCSRRLMKKEIVKSLASLKPIDHNQFGDLPMSDLDDPLPAVVRVLAETSFSTISIFHSLLLFLSVPVLKPKPSSSRWSLVFKQLQKGVLAGKDQQAGNMQNELERVDTAVGNLLMHNSSQDMEAQKIQSAQIRLGALDVSMEGLEKGKSRCLQSNHRILSRAERIHFTTQATVFTSRKRPKTTCFSLPLSLSLIHSTMTATRVATTHARNLMKLSFSLFRRGFNSSKCKTAAKMAVARIKLLRNKRQVVVKQMRRDIALLLQSGQDATARIRVEHVIREQNVLAANEFIELFCELVVSRLQIIAKQRECPADLKEGIASLIFAAPRCSEIPELVAIRNIFEKKYGKDFVSAATDLRPNGGVNRMLIDKLSVRTPTGEVKLKIMKEIAKEHNIQWDTTESELELLNAPEERLEGPNTFISATSLPLKPGPTQSAESNKPTTRENGNMHFEDTLSAAEAAAESAKKAIAAAQAAAYLANRDFNPTTRVFSLANKSNDSNINHAFDTLSGKSTGSFMPNDHSAVNLQNMDHQLNATGSKYESESFGRSHCVSSEETLTTNVNGGKVYRRQSYNALSGHSDIKFDESDCDEEIEMEEPPSGICPPPERRPPSVPSCHDKQDTALRVHPKLPDYDALAARFEALKYRKSLPKT